MRLPPGCARVADNQRPHPVAGRGPTAEAGSKVPLRHPDGVEATHSHTYEKISFTEMLTLDAGPDLAAQPGSHAH